MFRYFTYLYWKVRQVPSVWFLGYKLPIWLNCLQEEKTEQLSFNSRNIYLFYCLGQGQFVTYFSFLSFNCSSVCSWDFILNRYLQGLLSIGSSGNAMERLVNKGSCWNITLSQAINHVWAICDIAMLFSQFSFPLLWNKNCFVVNRLLRGKTKSLRVNKV